MPKKGSGKPKTPRPARATREQTAVALKYSSGGLGKVGSKHAINLMGAGMTGAAKREAKRKAAK